MRDIWTAQVLPKSADHYSEEYKKFHIGISCSVECIWLEIKINNKKYLYGTFYIPPNSGQQIWEELEQSIYLRLYDEWDWIG
jgi:hypothetical protein